MKWDVTRREDGQTLVYVTLSLVVLLLVVALAIDGGHLYAERRRMQNAADAGALAGAQALCLGRTQAEAEALAREYATTRNPAPTAYGQTADASADMGTYIVTVTTSEQPTLFLAGGLGIARPSVGAVSKAACGAANKACGLFPLALDKVMWDQVKGSCGKVFHIWSGDDDVGPDCTQCNCDTDPASPGNEFFPGAGRAWLDFSGAVNPLYPVACTQSGCSASEIKCWVENLNPAPVVIPKCISGTSGVKAGVKNEIEARAARPYPDNIVQIPLYTGPCTGITCTEGFYVTAFGCIKVMGWTQNLSLDPLPGKTCSWQGKVIDAAVSCDRLACANNCGSTTGGGCTGAEICAVSLVP